MRFRPSATTRGMNFCDTTIAPAALVTRTRGLGWATSPTIASAMSDGSAFLNPLAPWVPGGQFGVDERRQHHRELHARRAVLEPGRVGERDHRVLAGAVAGQPDGVELPGKRGDVDDVPGSAGDHPLHRQLAAQDHAVDVDVQNAPGDGVRLVDDPADRHDAGVVDQHVDRAELALDLVEEFRKRIRVGDIEFAVDVEAERRRPTPSPSPRRCRRSRPWRPNCAVRSRWPIRFPVHRR